MFTNHIKVVAAAGDKIGCEDLVRDGVWESNAKCK